MSEYKDNLWKFFIYLFSSRRSFAPLLSIFFLTLPGTIPKQIGFYSGLGYLASFLIETPSGYFADHFGYKKTLILSKSLAFLSTFLFVIANSFWTFTLGSVLMCLARSLKGGTNEAFINSTLTKLNRENEFAKIMTKISANVSLLCLPLILGLPFLTTIDIRLPFKVFLIVDLIGLLFVLSFKDIKQVIHHKEKLSIFKLIKRVKGSNFFPIAIFSGLILGFTFAHGPFRAVYLESLGLPIIFIGAVMSLSRFFWFLIGQKVHRIEDKFSVKQHFSIELFLFPLYFIIISFIPNIIILIIIMALVNGYMWSRNQLINHYLLKEIKGSKYKATYLSLYNQITSVIQFSLSFIAGFLMSISYKFGFLTLGIILFIVLVIPFTFMKKH
jgi:MFS family permease